MPAISATASIAARTGLLLFTGMQLAGTSVSACALCRPAVHAQVYNRDFPLNLLAVLFPIAAVLSVGLAVHHWERMRMRLRNGKEASRWKGP